MTTINLIELGFIAIAAGLSIGAFTKSGWAGAALTYVLFFIIRLTELAMK